MPWPHRTSQIRASLDCLSQSCDEGITRPLRGSTSGAKRWKCLGLRCPWAAPSDKSPSPFDARSFS